MTTEPKLYNCDNLEGMKLLPSNSIDCCVTDPPYELGFMGKKWDSTGISYSVDFWSEVLRVLKPGGHLLAFGGTRTYHRMACAIEDAGFEIRDQIQWLYGCLSDDTEILTKNGWGQYRISKNIRNFAAQEILIYDIQKNIYKWEVPERWSEYNIHEDTAYRIQSDNTDQIVSRNHRCIVEREGKLVFVCAEELSDMESMPTLQNDFYQLPKERTNLLQLSMQWLLSGSGMGQSRIFRGFKFNFGDKKNLFFERRQKSSLEGWFNLHETKRQICESINKICSLPERIYNYGTKRRLCYGTSFECGNGNRQTAFKNGVCASYEPQCGDKRTLEFNAIQNQFRPQTVRTWSGYKTSLAAVTPIKYSGLIFCPTVSTGAFVARRNGKVFITGNSGFPKSLNIGKAIDKKPEMLRVKEWKL